VYWLLLLLLLLLYQVESMSYDAFINQELILFSVADNQRSIPSVMDGLKPAQRKVHTHVSTQHTHSHAHIPTPTTHTRLNQEAPRAHAHTASHSPRT
jgi:hypothetical protein